VQIGSTDDPPLPVDADLRGKTTIRETAAVLAASEMFVGLEGFLIHLARAVDCPAVVVFGGRARPEIFGYGCNVNLYDDIDCAPCGLRDGCPHAMKCMTAISPERVAVAARELAQRRPARPLPAETTAIS
jgi:ADP-heptose:LPS heptosyltransferase